MSECKNCSGTGTIDIEDTNFAYDHLCAPSYRTEECPDCIDGEIEDDEN